MKRFLIAALLIITISFILGGVFYDQLPNQVASHWNQNGVVNGHMPRFLGAFLMPFVMMGMLVLFVIIPKIDPLKENIKKFEKDYHGLILAMMLFFFYMHLLTVLWNVGVPFNMTGFFIPAFGLLFYYLGVVIENAKRNWFIGIRTPWTLSSDVIWEKTHKLGGFLFKLAGIVAVIGTFFPNYMLYYILIPVILAALIPFIYSYFIFKKEKK